MIDNIHITEEIPTKEKVMTKTLLFTISLEAL